MPLLSETERVMDDFERLWVWDDPELAPALPWYRQVAANRRPAKFRIAATVPVEADPEAAGEDELWAELERLTPVFLARRAAIARGAAGLPATAAGPSLLELCAALAGRMLAHCNFCRWNCRVDRRAETKVGACKLGGAARVSSFFHHPGEELVYRGTRGSGTIFFTSCNMRCAFCQNGDISTDKDNGAPAGARELAAMAWLLRMEGCHNVNWVGGEVAIHLHRIVEAIALLGRGFAPTREDLARIAPAKADRFFWHDTDPAFAIYDGAFNTPMLWNSNFFMTPEAMAILRLLVDVWLPDVKFGPGGCAMQLAKTPWYWETVTGNMRTVVGWGEDATVRHLVMPNHVECCTYPVLEWLAAEAPGVPVNVMDQYHPDNFADPCGGKYRAQYAELAGRPRRAEIRAAIDKAAALRLPYASVTHERDPHGLAVFGL